MALESIADGAFGVSTCFAGIETEGFTAVTLGFTGGGANSSPSSTGTGFRGAGRGGGLRQGVGRAASSRAVFSAASDCAVFVGVAVFCGPEVFGGAGLDRRPSSLATLVGASAVASVVGAVSDVSLFEEPSRVALGSLVAPSSVAAAVSPAGGGSAV
jgi:hypothetical protein